MQIPWLRLDLLHAWKETRTQSAAKHSGHRTRTDEGPLTTFYLGKRFLGTLQARTCENSLVSEHFGLSYMVTL